MAQKLCYGCMRPIAEGESVCPVCGYRHRKEKTKEYALQPGVTLQNGKYLVGRVLGQGGFGITYIGLNRALNLKVAIKEYYPSGLVVREKENSAVYWQNESVDREKSKESFLKEARKMARLRSVSGIVRVQDVFYENETAYIVMDYVDGETLKNILKQNGLMKPEDCIDLLTPIIRSLGEAHAMGMIHRDVSPDNIMIDHMGKPWLLDMGAAKDLDNSGGYSQSSQGVIKRGFSPPEQYTDRKRVGTWSDVYAMCATIYYCLTGKLLPDAMDRMMGDELDFPQNFKPKIRSVLERGLSLKPAERIQTMDELLALLKQAVTPESPTSAPKPRVPETQLAKPSISTVTVLKTKPTKSKRSRLPMILISLLLCAALGIGGFFLWGDKGDDKIPTVSPEVNSEQSPEPEQAAPEESTPTLTPTTPTPETATPTPAPATPTQTSTPATTTPIPTTPTPTPEPNLALASGNFDHVGGIVTFGSYEQDNDLTNGSEPIEWIVLDVQDGKSLLISRYVLDCQQYHSQQGSVTWETSSLRQWMNDTFLSNAFNAAEQDMICTVTVSADKNPAFTVIDPGNPTEDMIFVLSINEANAYFATDEERQCTPTEYAKEHEQNDLDTYGAWRWLLRSPGRYVTLVADVTIDGKVDLSGVNLTYQYAVRPALWVTLP